MGARFGGLQIKSALAWILGSAAQSLVETASALPASNPLPAHGSGKVNMFAEPMHQGFTVTSGDLLF